MRSPGWEKDVDSLATSIAAQGQLEPVKVKLLDQPGPNGEKYSLIFGYRRVAACAQLQHSLIDALVETHDDIPAERFPEKSDVLQRLVENIERFDLSPLEEALAYKKLVDDGMKAKEIAKAVGRTEGYLSQRLGMLKLTETIQESLAQGRISATHARELSRIKDEEQQEKLLDKAEKLSSEAFKSVVEGVLHPEEKIPRESRENKEDGEEREVKSGKPSNDGPEVRARSYDEIQEELHRVYTLRLEAAKKKDKIDEARAEGMIKGIIWATRLKGKEIAELLKAKS